MATDICRDSWFVRARSGSSNSRAVTVSAVAKYPSGRTSAETLAAVLVDAFKRVPFKARMLFCTKL
jgi:hypothetical protein